MNIISKSQAKEQGLKYYFTGKPCKYGHMSKRFTTTSNCYGCTQQQVKKWNKNNPEYQKQYGKNYRNSNPQYNKEWNENNPEYHKFYHKIWSIENADHLNQYQKDWCADNPEYHKIWQESNPEKCFQYARIRTIKLEQSIPCWYEEELVKQIYLKRNELNELWGTNMVVDHIIPLNPKCKTVSGLHCWANLQLLDNSLNCSKGSNYQTDW